MSNTSIWLIDRTFSGATTHSRYLQRIKLLQSIYLSIYLCSYLFIFDIYLFETFFNIYVYISAHGVMVIVVGNGHIDTSSNPGPG